MFEPVSDYTEKCRVLMRISRGVERSMIAEESNTRPVSVCSLNHNFLALTGLIETDADGDFQYRVVVGL